MSENTTKQRILDLKGLCASSEITLKEVISHAGMPYRSVLNAFNNALRHGVRSISSERLTQLENAALELRAKQEPEKVAQ